MKNTQLFCFVHGDYLSHSYIYFALTFAESFKSDQRPAIRWHWEQNRYPEYICTEHLSLWPTVVSSLLWQHFRIYRRAQMAMYCLEYAKPLFSCCLCCWLNDGDSKAAVHAYFHTSDFSWPSLNLSYYSCDYCWRLPTFSWPCWSLASLNQRCNSSIFLHFAPTLHTCCHQLQPCSVYSTAAHWYRRLLLAFLIHVLSFCLWIKYKLNILIYV